MRGTHSALTGEPVVLLLIQLTMNFGDCESTFRHKARNLLGALLQSLMLRNYAFRPQFPTFPSLVSAQTVAKGGLLI